MYKFPFTVTVTLPVSQTSWWLGDVPKNGLFVIGGSWDIDTWDPQNILHYTCVYQPSHDWYVRNTQQRKMLLNHAIIRMVPYEPHCRIHWDHFDIWRTYARGITRSAIVGEMDHRRVGKVRSHSREFGHNFRATHTLTKKGPIYDPMNRYALKWDPPIQRGTIYWPTAEECFWECTHPMQWTSRLYTDVKGYSPFYEHRRLRDHLNDFGVSYRRYSPEFAFMFAENTPVLFFRGRDECLIPHPAYAVAYDGSTDEFDMGYSKPETIYPGLLPAEEYYDSMVTWKEALSKHHHETAAFPEIGFQAVFGEVDPKWYMEWYIQLRRKVQVQRQIVLLIFDIPDRISLYHEYYDYNSA